MRPFLLLAALIPSLAGADFTYDQARIDRERAEGEAKGYVYPDATSVARPVRGTGAGEPAEVVDGVRVLPGANCDAFQAFAPICPEGDPMEWAPVGNGSCRLHCTTTTPSGGRSVAANGGSSRAQVCAHGMGTDGCTTTCWDADEAPFTSGASLVSPAR